MGDLDDFQGFDQRLQNELDRFDQYDGVDRPHVQRFVRKLDGRVETSSLAEYLKNLRGNARRLDGPLVELTEDEYDQFVFELRHSDEYGQGADPGLSDGTVRNYQFVVRKFLAMADRHADHDLSWAEEIELVKPSENRLSPDDMLLDADINALCQGANNLRDIAMIEFLADSGARLSLVGSLRVGDVDLEADRPTFTPNPNASGLKGADIRPYPIIDSKATLRTYLNRLHPRPDRNDVAFFHAVAGHGNDVDEDEDGSITPSTVRRQLRKAADSVGVDKPVNPHNFRHSAITRMRREGWDRAEVEHRVHWTVDSDMWRIYEHISGEEHNEAIWERVGVTEPDENESAERRPCGNCLERVASYHDYCPRCGDALTPKAREATRETTAEGSDVMLVIDGQPHRVAANEILQAVASNDVQPDVGDSDHD